VEVVLEAMKSGGGVVALGEERAMMEGKERRRYIVGTFSPG
jgi:hypothetical protein